MFNDACTCICLRKQVLEICLAEMIHLFWYTLYVWQAMWGEPSVSHLWDPREVRHFPLEHFLYVYTQNIHNFRYGFLLPLHCCCWRLFWRWHYGRVFSGGETCLARPGGDPGILVRILSERSVSLLEHLAPTFLFQPRFFLGAFDENRLLASSCLFLSFLLHGTTRLPLDGFSWNLVFWDFFENPSKNPCLIAVWQDKRVLYMKTYIYIYIYIYSLIHSLSSLPYDRSKDSSQAALHTVRSRASSFKWQNPLLSLRSSISFLRLLPRLPVTSIPSFYLPFNNPL
jgi:hypothetical protein